jgi:thymidylate kinase
VVMPALQEYDYIIQDRGILTGLAYGEACGNDYWFLTDLAKKVTEPLGCSPLQVYNKIIYLRSDPVACLARAKAIKQEFTAGDAMEAKGNVFMAQVAKNMDTMVKLFPHSTIDVGNKTIIEVSQEILSNLD